MEPVCFYNNKPVYFYSVNQFKEYFNMSKIIVTFDYLIYDDIINNLDLFKKIQCLDCSNTHLEKIPKELVNLRYLDCSNTQITEIPKELINLQELICYETEVTEIPKELVNLRILDCYDTLVRELPVTLERLTHIRTGFINISGHKENIEKYKNKIKDIITNGNVLNDDVNTLICYYI